MYYYESMQKKTHRKMSQITWQRAIFTGASPDIVAADMLNFCVRDENRCVHIAIATRSLWGLYHSGYASLSLKTE